ncbi:MAG: ABC transporter permease, partial [Clostridia bacterium]
MAKYIIKRILLSLIILLGVSIIIFTLVRLMPVDYIESKYAAQLSQGQITQEQVDAIKDIYGLNDDVFTGYCKWLGNFFQGNLGDSFIYSVTLPDGSSSQKVVDVISSKMGISFLLAFISTILQYLIAIPLGIISATKQYSFTDYSVTVLAMMGISLPSFFLGALLMRVFSVELGWFPLQGLVDATVIHTDLWSLFLDQTWHLVLPMVVLVVLSIGGLMRYTRTNMLEVLNSDYIRTARAKGLSEHTVVYKHAFRNTLIPLVTMLAGVLPGLFGGAMITETVFAIP